MRPARPTATSAAARFGMVIGGRFSRSQSRKRLTTGKSEDGGRACGVSPPPGKKQALAPRQGKALHKSRVDAMDGIDGGHPLMGILRSARSTRTCLTRGSAILTYVFVRYVALSDRTKDLPPEEHFLDAVLRRWGEWVTRREVLRSVRAAKLYVVLSAQGKYRGTSRQKVTPAFAKSGTRRQREHSSRTAKTPRMRER